MQKKILHTAPTFRFPTAALCLLAACAGRQPVPDLALTGDPNADLAIYHLNQMGSAFALQGLVYTLDNREVLNTVDKDGDLSNQPSVAVFTGRVPSGRHRIDVTVAYAGRNYLAGYHFTLTSSYTFNAEQLHPIVVKAIGYPVGGTRVPPQNLPAFRYDVEESAPPIQPTPTNGSGNPEPPAHQTP